MGDAPRHLAPRGLFLRAQQVGQIFEHQDISEALGGVAERGNRHRNIQLRSRQTQIHVGAP